MKKIPLTRNSFALVDNEDFEYLSQWHWFLSGKGYAERYNGQKKSPIKMHSQIMNTPNGLFCDHINGNRLDNRKSNLRLVTNQQNLCNRGKASNNTSGYKGVSFQCKKWYAKITSFGKQHHLGSFKEKIDAARAYDKAAKELHGEFARLNFPDNL